MDIKNLERVCQVKLRLEHIERIKEKFKERRYTDVFEYLHGFGKGLNEANKAKRLVAVFEEFEKEYLEELKSL